MHRVVRTLMLALAFAVFGAAAARADTLTITTGADPTEEVPIPITASWTSAADENVYVTIKPSGPLGCAATYAIDVANSSQVIHVSGAGTQTATQNWTLEAPGTFTLCGYVQDSSSSTSTHAVAGPVTLTVRSARASVAIVVPARVDPGQTFALSFPTTTELSRDVYVTIKTAGGRGCEATYALDIANSAQIGHFSTQGTSTSTTTYTASNTAGTYLLCAYVQEGSSDSGPEATASATFLVGPDPCVTAKAALTKARKAVKVAETSVTRNSKAYNKYKKAAKRAHGARRKTLQKKAKTYKSRYTSAVHTRSKARAKLATAQSGVTGACG